MAHGLLQALNTRLQVFSAGTQPAERVHPMAVQVLQEIGIDISQHTPTHVSRYLHQEWDYVITVCGGANESCPAFVGKVSQRLHIGFTDPSLVQGTEQERLRAFRHTRDEIQEQMQNFHNFLTS
jgi:arsenate reductase